MITVLTGGTGGSKFVDGLRQIVRPEELTIIVNTGDDLLWWGLYVSPDLDSITYMLAGKLSQERGWGVKGDTFFCLNAMGQLGQPAWLHVGDRDLATHLLRTKLLSDGQRLSEATSEIAARLGIKVRVLPMSNSRVETRVLTPAGDLSFEEYFVQRWYQDPVESVRYAGASDAEPAPGVIEAIRSADLVLLAPSSPVSSIASRSAARKPCPHCGRKPDRRRQSGLWARGNTHGSRRLRSFDCRRCRLLSRLPRSAGGRFAGRVSSRILAHHRNACALHSDHHAQI